MADFPGYGKPPPFLHTWSRFGVLEAANTATSFAATSTTWTTANQARYYPISIPFAYLVNRVFWVNGSTTTSTNNDFGIYTPDGVRLYSTGSTAQSGASVPQFVTPSTPLWLPPGDYYFGMNCSSASTNRITGNAITGVLQRYAGIKQEAVGSVTLPATATFAAASVAGINLCGITWTDSGF